MMASKTAKASNSPKKIKRRRIDFKYRDANAQEVNVVGDFNKWNAGSHPMKQADGGIWKKTMMLPEGTYEYKFIVDGAWTNDPMNEETCVNDFGTVNNRIKIS
jgi:1,4-alpha-glucan branching enzyme